MSVDSIESPENSFFKSDAASNVKPGLILDKVYVMTAIWDNNFHHLLHDSLSRLVWHLESLNDDPYANIYLHMREYEKLKFAKLSKKDKIKAQRIREAVFNLLEINTSRIVYGDVAARKVY